MTEQQEDTRPARRRRRPRHPAEVTLIRLATAMEKWPDAFGPGDRDEVSHIIDILDRIAEGEPTSPR